MNAVQWDVHSIHAAVIGMVFEAKNELKQYFSSINPMHTKHTECLWAKEVNSTAQLAVECFRANHACDVENSVFMLPVSLPSQRQQASDILLLQYYSCSLSSK